MSFINHDFNYGIRDYNQAAHFEIRIIHDCLTSFKVIYRFNINSCIINSCG